MKTLTFRTFFVLTGVAMLSGASAQTGGEFFLTGSGGLSTLRYSIPAASFRYGYGGSLGAGYSFFFHPQWEASLGIEVGWTGARLKLPLLEDAYRATDGDVPPKDFEFQYAMHGYYERQNISLLEIPLTLRYHFGKHPKFTWYAGAGIRAGIPLTAAYTAGSERLEAQGGYADYSDPNNVLWFKHPLDAGFGTFENVKGSGSYSAKTAWMATVEAGVRLPLRSRWRLSAGPFLDYGFSSVISGAKDEHPVYYTANSPFEPVRYAHRSLLTSSDGQGKAYAGTVIPLMAGLRVRLSFGEDGRRNAGKTPPPLAAESIPKIETAQKHELVQRYEPEHEEEEQPARRESAAAPRAATKVHVQGTVTDELSKQPVEAQLFVIDNHTHHVIATVESRPDNGSYSFDLPRGSAYSVTANATSYLVSLGKVDLTDYSIPSTDTIRRNIAMLKIAAGASVTLHNIHFDFNQTTPNSVSIPELEQIAQWLKDNPQVKKVEFSGHTDNRGSAEVNRYISELRAKAVCDYLIGRGIAAERLSHAGYGLTRPVADNATIAGRAQNRRVELTIKSIEEPEGESE
jgi:outer membrane protein OmpA-like peptidoglycan-associated protein